MKKTFINTGLFILGIAGGLVLLEGYFQLIEFQQPYFELSARQGKKMLPNKNITYFGEGFYLGKTNQYGYLGTGYAPQRDPGKIRIAMVGDSYVEGLQVFDHHHFTRITEQKLNAGLASPKYEVLNFGVGNYNFNDMIIGYMNFVKAFNPDIVVFVLKDDDFTLTNNFIPSPVLKNDGDTVIIDYSFATSGTFKVYKRFAWAFENSAVVFALNNSYKIFNRRSEGKRILFDKFYTAFSVKTEPSSKPAKTIPDERLLKSFAWLKDKHCIFIFRSYIPDVLTARANAMDIKVVNVYAELEEKLRDKGFDYNYWDITGLRGHWNFLAQDFVGNYIFNEIKAQEKISAYK